LYFQPVDLNMAKCVVLVGTSVALDKNENGVMRCFADNHLSTQPLIILLGIKTCSVQYCMINK
jgi:hypothetical protein